MMPESRYDERAHDWVSFSQGERAAMSAAYNLRVGLIIAALCFGASERVDQVCVRIDSIGLEEAVAEQDSAISDLMSAALRSFERLHTGDAGASKADPKDGDHHGDPSHTPSAEPASDARTPQADARGAQDAKTDSAGESVSATVGDDDLQSLESFADMMKDINFEDFVRTPRRKSRTPTPAIRVRRMTPERPPAAKATKKATPTPWMRCAAAPPCETSSP